MFNKVVLLGHLTRDIELRYTTAGAAIGNSAIAVTRKFTLNGEKREETCFVDIVFFGKSAEIANQYLFKGSKLLIEGRLKFDQWQDNNGQSRSKHSVAVEVMEMLGEPKQGAGGYSNGGQYQQSSYQGYGQQQGGYQGRQTQNYQQRPAQKAAPAKERYDDAPEIDVDADKYENDDTIPF